MKRSGLFEFILDTKKYLSLYNLMERMNRYNLEYTSSLFGEMHDTVHNINFSTNAVSFTLEEYDTKFMSYTLDRTSTKEYPFTGRIHPSYISMYKYMNFIECTPCWNNPETTEEKKALDEAFIQLPGFNYGDISAELFQIAMQHEILSEKELQEVVNRVYNLPYMGNTILHLTNNISQIEYTDLDKFLRGY